MIESKLGVKVEERQVSIHELINSDKEDRLLSMFGVSTHSPLQPVHRVCYRDTTMLLNNNKKGIEFNKQLDNLLISEMKADSSSPWITEME